MTYKVGVSGWAVIEVEASSSEEAERLVQEERPGVAGELYDLEVHETVLDGEPFQIYTSLE